MSNSGGTSILQTLNDQKTQIEDLKDEIRTLQQKFDRKLQQSSKEQSEALSIVQDEVEELRQEWQQNLELTQDFLTLRQGELEER
ncbi:hypothetical protein V8E54_000934 [Elaphomyces granulatus]